jgi:hypothetical protein
MGVINKDSILKYCETQKKAINELFQDALKSKNYNAAEYLEHKWMIFQFDIPRMIEEIEIGE